MSDLKAIVLPAAALLLSALLLLTTSLAFADQAPHSFDISPQALESALSEFARQGSQTILFAPAIVAGKMTKGIHGKFDPLQALTTLLQGTGLTFTTTKSGAILLGPPQGSPGGSHNPERGAEAEHSSLDEVIVTAEKRSEFLSKTAVAVTALRQELLDAQGVTNVSGLNGLVPNFSVGVGSGEPRPNFTIRGVTSSNLTELGNPGIAFHVDGVYVPRPVGMSQTLYDIDRIEVLRGPQGTLYGKSATAGSINVIAARPVFEDPYGKADVSVGNYGAWTARAMLNIPVSDAFAMRVSAISDRNDGFQGTAGTTRERQQLIDQHGARIATLWRLSTSLTWYLAYEYFRDTGVPSYAVDLTAPAAAGRDPWNRPLSSAGYIDNQQSSIRTHLDWTMNDAVSVSYIAGYSHIDRSAGEGFDESSTITGRWTFPTLATGHNYSHEIDIHFGGASRFHGLLGALLFHEWSDGDFILNMPPELTLHFSAPDVQQKSRAAFTQTTFDWTDTLHLTAGARYTKDDLSTNRFVTYSCPFGTPLTAAPASCSAADNSRAASWSKLTWRAAVEYQAMPGHFTYLSVSTGYKPGGFGDRGTPAFNPETVTSVEAGLKSRLLDGRLSLNNAVFFMDYRDLQVSTTRPDPVTGAFALVTENAANASIYGLESEYEWLITPTDRLSGYVAMLRATYDEYTGAPDPFLSGAVASVDLSGKRLVKTPSFSQQLTYEHIFSLQGGASVVPSITAYWQTAMYLRAYNEAVDRQPAYSRTNLALAYHAPKDRWSLSGFVNNVEDKDVLQTVQTYVVGNLAGTYLQPRTYGLRCAFGF